MKKYRHLILLGVALAALLPACAGPASVEFPDGATYGKHKLLVTKYDNADANKAKQNADDVLTQLANEPNVGLIGLWAYNPPAILEAVKAAKREGKVKIVGFDEDEQTLRGVRDGHIYATVVQQPFEFGYQSVKLMAALVKDPKTPLPANSLMHVPHVVVKKDNVDDFHENLKKQKASGALPAKPTGAETKVAFVSNNPHEFWSIVEAGTRKAADEFGVEVIFRRPKDANAAGQKEIIDDLLTQGVKAIAISVNDPENQKEYLNQIADKVILITVDNDAPGTKRKVYIGTNNIEAGKEVGRLVKEVMPDGGTIAIFVGQPDPINAKQRRQGVLEALREAK